MKKVVFTLSLAALLLAATGCATHVTVRPAAVSANPIGSKVGTVEATYHSLSPNKVAEVPAYKAAQQAGITKIATVDVKVTEKVGFLGSRFTVTTIVTGE